MDTPQRFTVQYDILSRAWYVHDHLHQRRALPAVRDAPLAIAQASLWESFWRAACRRWQQQEGLSTRWWAPWSRY